MKLHGICAWLAGVSHWPWERVTGIIREHQDAIAIDEDDEAEETNDRAQRTKAGSP